MKTKTIYFLILIICLMLTGSIFALDPSNENRLAFGHVLNIKNITLEPAQIIPGSPAVLKVFLINNGNMSASDIRMKLILPEEIAFSNDVSDKQIPVIDPDEQKVFEFNIIALPKTIEGVYKASLVADYVNYVGQERQDNYSTGIIVKSTPKIFAQADKTDIYDTNRIGDITITFTNNNLANIKFMTAELGDSKDYEIISENKKYIGDLDSGDYQSVDFRIKVKDNLNAIVFPVEINYKDSLNKDYTEDLLIPFKIMTAKDLGINNTNYSWWILIIAIIAVIAVFIYKKFFSKKKKYE
jgi:hypothetical protein